MCLVSDTLDWRIVHTRLASVGQQCNEENEFTTSDTHCTRVAFRNRLHNSITLCLTLVYGSNTSSLSSSPSVEPTLAEFVFIQIIQWKSPRIEPALVCQWRTHFDGFAGFFQRLRSFLAKMRRVLVFYFYQWRGRGEGWLREGHPERSSSSRYLGNKNKKNPPFPTSEIISGHLVNKASRRRAYVTHYYRYYSLYRKYNDTGWTWKIHCHGKKACVYIYIHTYKNNKENIIITANNLCGSHTHLERPTKSPLGISTWGQYTRVRVYRAIVVNAQRLLFLTTHRFCLTPDTITTFYFCFWLFSIRYKLLWDIDCPTARRLGQRTRLDRFPNDS